VGSGDDLDGLGGFTVTGHRPQLSPVDADHVSQGMSVTFVALGPRGAIPFLEPAGLQRIDRIDLIASRDQRLHPRAAVGLDSDHNLVRFLKPPGADGLSYQRMQLGDPSDPLRQLPGRQYPSGLVLDLHIMMVVGPVITDEQQQRFPLSHRSPPVRQPEGGQHAP
jgi:hypothetical protein